MVGLICVGRVAFSPCVCLTGLQREESRWRDCHGAISLERAPKPRGSDVAVAVRLLDEKAPGHRLPLRLIAAGYQGQVKRYVRYRT